MRGWFKPSAITNQEKVLESIQILNNNIDPENYLRQTSIGFSIEKEADLSASKVDGPFLRTKSRKPTRETGFFHMSLRPVEMETEGPKFSKNGAKYPKSKLSTSSSQIVAENSKSKTETDYDRLNRELLFELEAKISALARNQTQSKAECLSMATKLEKLHTRCMDLVHLAKTKKRNSNAGQSSNNRTESAAEEQSQQITRKGSKEKIVGLTYMEDDRANQNREGSTLARMPKKMFTGDMSNTDQPSVAIYSHNHDLLDFQSFRKSSEKNPGSSKRMNQQDMTKFSQYSGSKRHHDSSVRAKIARQRTEQEGRDLSNDREHEDFSSDCNTPSRASIRPTKEGDGSQRQKRANQKEADPRSRDKSK